MGKTEISTTTIASSISDSEASGHSEISLLSTHEYLLRSAASMISTLDVNLSPPPFTPLPPYLQPANVEGLPLDVKPIIAPGGQ